MTSEILNQYGQPFEAKAHTSNELWSDASIRVIDMQRSSRGGKLAEFDYTRAVYQFRSWVYAAVNLNAVAVASVPLRLYVRARSSTLFRTRAVPPHRKRYLTGMLDHGPHRHVQAKLVEFGEDFEEVTDVHPVLDLIRTVNPWQNGFDLLQLLSIYLDLCGNAYWHPVIGDMGIPDELWPMPSQWVQVLPDRETFIKGYVYGRSHETRQEFAPDEVIHFRTANPSNEGLWYGMGKVEAGWDAVALNAATHQMDRAFADNHARPDYIALCKAGTNQDQLDRFEAKVESKLRGSRQSGKFLAITQDIQLQPLTFQPQDITGRVDIVEEIAAVFGVPVSLLKANDPNLASARVGYASWKSNTILPMCRLIEQKLNEQLLPLFGIEDNALLAFDNPVPQDREFDLTEGTQLVGAGLRTINEERAIRGDAPIAGGDVPRISGVPLDQIGQPNPMLSPFTLREPGPPASAPAPASPSFGGDAIGELTTVVARLAKTVASLKAKVASPAPAQAPFAPHSPAPPPAAKVERRPGESADACVARAIPLLIDEGMDRDQAIAAARAMCGDKTVWQSEHLYAAHKSPEAVGDADDTAREGQPSGPEAALEAALARVLEAARATLLLALGAEPEKAVKRGTTPEEIEQALRALEYLADDLEREILEPLGRMLAAGGAAGVDKLTALGADVAGGLFNTTNPAVQQFIERYVIRLSGELAQSLVDRIRDELLDSVARGLSIPEMAARIDAAGIFDRARATMIARAESATAYVEGQHEAWRQSEVVEGKTWLLAPDPCPFCEATAKAYNQRTIALDDAFWKLGDTVVGTDGTKMKLDYRDITGPPLHPNCRCDTIAVLKEPGQ